nr:unnamed protein product [Callosobruchus chinensis]
MQIVTIKVTGFATKD